MRKIKRFLIRTVAAALAIVLALIAFPLVLLAGEDTPAENREKHEVSIENAEGGTLIVMKDGKRLLTGEEADGQFFFYKGEDVLLQPEAEDGYAYQGTDVYLGNGPAICFSPEEEIRFAMPGCDVRVAARFEKIPEEVGSALKDGLKEVIPKEEILQQEAPATEKKETGSVRAAGDTSDFWADPAWGEADVLFYGRINGKTVPAYCIDHGADVPYSYYTQIDPVFYAKELGYVMKHGYPNEDWNLSGPEAQFLTQTAVYAVLGVDLWNVEGGMQPPSFIYNALWGNGNFSIATDLAARAAREASSADAAYVSFWYPTGNPSSQRMITPLPYVPEGWLTIVKEIAPKTADIRLVKKSAAEAATEGNPNYSLEGAAYGIYSDEGCTQLIGTMTTDADGIADYKGLELKTYYVKEIRASKGYRLSSEVITYDLSSFESRYARDAVYTVSGNGKTFTMNCDALSGMATLTLEEGTYTITETGAAKGTIRNTGSQTVTVASEKTTTVTGGIALNQPEVYRMDKTVTEEPLMLPVGLLLQKVDAATGKQVPQGDTSLAGAQFTVNYYPDTFTGALEEPSAPVRSWIFRSDASGEVQYAEDSFVSGVALYQTASGVPALPIGTITVKETMAPEGYFVAPAERILTIALAEEDGIVHAALIMYDAEGNRIDVQDLMVGNEAADLNIRADEQVFLGGVQLQKVSAETGLALPQGGAALQGAKITLFNDSIHPVLVNGKEYLPGEAVMVLETDENGAVSTGEKKLPYGSYIAAETESPEGYILNEDWRAVFQIREDGVIVDLTSEPLADQVVRRGFEFKKTVEGKEPVANCLFAVTMTATGETHYIVTDPNGRYHSRRFAANNGNDAAVIKNEDGIYTVDESLLSCRNNVWFSMDSEGNAADPAEGYDAFVYGEYLFQEVRTSANAGLDLISFYAYVYEDGSYLAADGDVYDLGTKDDHEIMIGTTAADTADGDKRVLASGEVTITDHVKYENLTVGKEYTLEGTLFNKTIGAVVTDEAGNAVTGSATFTPQETSGTVDVPFVFSGNLLKEAKQIVVFEDLKENDMLLLVHSNPNDSGQTVIVEKAPVSQYPKTGDKSNILFWGFSTFGAALVAAGGMIYLFKKKKR